MMEMSVFEVKKVVKRMQEAGGARQEAELPME